MYRYNKDNIINNKKYVYNIYIYIYIYIFILKGFDVITHEKL